MVKEYKARMSGNNMLITVIFNFITFLLVCQLAFGTVLYKNTYLMQGYLKHTLLAILIMLILLAFGLHPYKYKITDENILICCPFRTISIPIHRILDIKNIEYGDLNINFKSFGSAGIWGYYGIFQSNYFGKINRYAATLKDLVFIATNKKRIYVISLNNPQDFINDLTKSFDKISKHP